MSRIGLIVLDPACIALAFAAIDWLAAVCWAIVFARSTLGAATGLLLSAAGAAASGLGTKRGGAVVTAATVVPRATGSTRKGPATGGSPALLGVFEAGTGVVSATLAVSRAGTCRRRLAAANPDLEIERIELMHLA
jgi:hypothetical protein